MLGAVYLAAILAPLLIGLGLLVVLGLRRLDAHAAVRADALSGPPVPVAELRLPEPPVLPSLPVGFRYDAIMPGPLQIVDAEEPTTKVCPDCAETVLHTARVCKHCQYRFDPPLRGSHAV